MQVSHGCVRLYPEDIERLFPTVPVGTPGEFVYQPVKVGMREGHVYVEAHQDIYRMLPGPYREAVSLIERFGRRSRVDFERVRRFIRRCGCGGRDRGTMRVLLALSGEPPRDLPGVLRSPLEIASDTVPARRRLPDSGTGAALLPAAGIWATRWFQVRATAPANAPPQPEDHRGNRSWDTQDLLRALDAAPGPRAIKRRAAPNLP